MVTRRRKIKKQLRLKQWGFTLIEMMVIVVVIGVLSATAAPSLSGMLDAAKVNQAVSDLRLSLQDTQRQAIRKNQVCTYAISQDKGHEKRKGRKKTTIEGTCLASGSPEISDDVGVASNLRSSSTAANQSLEITFGTLGGADFNVQSSVQPPNLPTDPSGKIVAYIPNKDNVPKKCVAVSSTLGLTRIGTYKGSTIPADITDRGVCTALNWKQQ